MKWKVDRVDMKTVNMRSISDWRASYSKLPQKTGLILAILRLLLLSPCALSVALSVCMCARPRMPCTEDTKKTTP